MAFTIPDKGEGLNDNQSIFFQEYMDVLVAGISEVDCVLSGCAVTAQVTPDMTVAVASGKVVSNNALYSVTGANATIAVADATNPRFDLVVITSAGAIAVRAGTAAAAPKPPARAANDVVLAVVYVPAGDTAINSNQIVDLRALAITPVNANFSTLGALTGATLASGDLFVGVDVSDTTIAASGTNKKITAGELLIGLAAISSVLTLSTLTLASGTLATNRPSLDIRQTWNDAAVAFVAQTTDITDTASAAGSLLGDWKVGGVSKFSIKKDGSITTSAGGAVHNLAGILIVSSYISTNSALYFGGSVGLTGRDNSDTYRNTIYTPVANVFEFRNALALTTAQTLRVYNTYTDAANYQRLELGWNVSTALLMNTGAGTGADGSVAFNDAALATTATKGFIMIPSCAGAPTGVPADIPAGQVPLVFDSTNNKIYAYDGAWISTAALV